MRVGHSTAGGARGRRAAALSALFLLASLLAGAAPARAVAPGANGLIACEGFRDGDFEVYVMNPDGSGVRYLTDNSVRDGDPAWSPDGRQISFESVRDGNSEVYVMDADGTNVRRLTFAPGEDRGTSWSPDGSQITFHSTRAGPPGGPHGPGNFEVWVMNADGTGQRNITNSPAFEAQPDWSPLGDRIAFNSQRDTPAGEPSNFEIYTVRPDGSDLRRLTNSPGEDSGPVWSPDGTQISFQSRRDGNLDIYRMNADGTGVTQLTFTEAPVFNAFSFWSPDGTRIGFTSTRDSAPGTFEFEVYTMNAADGSDVRRLTFMEGFDGRCHWQRLTPTDMRECKDNGWQRFNSARFERFKNQGACVSFVASGKQG